MTFWKKTDDKDAVERNPKGSSVETWLRMLARPNPKITFYFVQTKNNLMQVTTTELSWPKHFSKQKKIYCGWNRLHKFTKFFWRDLVHFCDHQNWMQLTALEMKYFRFLKEGKIVKTVESRLRNSRKESSKIAKKKSMSIALSSSFGLLECPWKQQKRKYRSQKAFEIRRWSIGTLMEEIRSVIGKNWVWKNY